MAKVVQFLIVQVVIWVVFGGILFYPAIAGIIGLAHGLALLTSD